MFHKVKNVKALPNFILQVDFLNGITKQYDVKPLFKLWQPFIALQNTDKLFTLVRVDAGGYGISWNDDIDLSCDELWENGIIVN